MKRLIFYYADWCSGCRNVKPVLKALESKYSDVTFEYVDMDTSVVLQPVSSVPTVVMERDGLEVANLAGTQAKYTYEYYLKQL